MKHTKKLIEVALPLDAINEASSREKSIRNGHPSSLHLWWARRPLAAARAVIFAQMVDDPSEYVDVLLSDPKKRRAAARELKARLDRREARPADTQVDAVASPVPTLEDVAAEHERDRLFEIIKALVKWKNTDTKVVIQQARDEIWQSWRRNCAKHADHSRADELFNRHKLPAFHDPFAGGGALPLEAQRLGLDAFASDLNPVAVLINKAMIEIPQKFVGRPPINPESRRSDEINADMQWRGVEGMAKDIYFYGKWVQTEAIKRIGSVYPKITITADMARDRRDLNPYVGRTLSIIAWLWTRTVKSPNPAFSDIHVPLISNYVLSKRKGKKAYIEPRINGKQYTFVVRRGDPPTNLGSQHGTRSSGSGSPSLCLLSGTPMSFDYVRSEGKAGRMGVRLLSIVAQGDRERVYLTPVHEHELVANTAGPDWSPDTKLPEKALGFRIQEYGMNKWKDLFSSRQLVALTTISDLIGEAVVKITRDASLAHSSTANAPSNGDSDQLSYAESIGMYLGFALSKQADLGNQFCRWEPNAQCPRQLFGRQAIPMVWDYAEGNPLGDSSGSWMVIIDGIARALANSFQVAETACIGNSIQQDAGNQHLSKDKVVSTDPPYYDNIGYSDLSDFFYVWMRHSLGSYFPDLFATILVPKAEELVANPYRHGGSENAESFFLDGMGKAMKCLSEQVHPAFPVSIYYAFKQAEKKADSGVSSTGWETFLGAVIRAGFTIVGTLPLRTENASRMVGQGTNALASSIVLVCRPRSVDASIITLREFIARLNAEIPLAIRHLRRSSIAPVDLAQASIGPGMAVYTRYSRILDSSGRVVSVRDALSLINQKLDEILAEQEGDCDSESRWAVAWFEQFGFSEGDYGIAEILSKAKNTSVASLLDAKILRSEAGNIRLLRPNELPSDWDPEKSSRVMDWQVVHHLIRVLEADGEEAASGVVRPLMHKVGTVHELCYRLYTLCERKKRFAEATSYNTLVKSWPEIVLRARSQASQQGEMFS